MSNETFLLFIIIVLVIISLPSWPYSKSWGYRPTGVLTVLLAVFLIWAIAGDRPLFRRSVGHDIRSAGRDLSESIRHEVQ
jgi:hypothetical protein